MRSRLFKTVTALVAFVTLLWASGVVPAAYNRILDEAVALTPRSNLNFTGAGVTCADNAGTLSTDCTIPGGGGGATAAGAPAYREDFIAAGSVTMTGVEHGFGSANLQVSCYDNAAPANYFEPTSVTIDQATFDVVATFAGAPTGYCVVQGGGALACATYTVDFNDAAFTAASAGVDVALFTLAQYGKVSGSTIKHSTEFGDGGGAMTDVTVSVGNAVAPYTQYAPAYSIGEANPVADDEFQDTTGFKSTTMAAAGGSVSARFTSVGRDFGDGKGTFLTQGEVNIWVCSLRVQ